MFMDLNHTSILAALLEWALMTYPAFINFLRYLHLLIKFYFFYFFPCTLMYMYLVIRQQINVFNFVQGRMREVNRSNNVPKFIHRIELVQKKSIMYYQQHSSQPFLKIVVTLPTMVASCRGKVDNL